MAVRGAKRTPSCGASAAVPVPVVGAWHAACGVDKVPIEGQVLVEFVYVKRLDVGDDVGAQLRDVHIAEVNVLPPATAVHQPTTLMLQITLAPMMQVGLRGGGGCGRTVRLTCNHRSAGQKNS